VIYHERITLTGASDTGYSDSPVFGWIKFLKVSYTNGNATTGALTITDEDSGIVIHQVSASATDVEAPVRKQAIDESGTAITGVYGEIPVSSRIKAVSSGHNANTEITIDVYYERPA